MVLENDHYAYRVTWVDEDSEYVGLCLEYPSLSWLDESPETALMGIRKVVHDVVEDMIERNEQIPTTLATRKYSGKFMVRIPPEAHKTLAIEAAEAGISMNRLVNSKLIHRKG